MIDQATYLAMYPEGHIPPSTFFHDPHQEKYAKWPVRIHDNESFPTDVELVLPHSVKGFHFETKKWGACSLSRAGTVGTTSLTVYPQLSFVSMVSDLLI